MNSEIRQNFSNPGNASGGHQCPGMIPAGPDGKVADALMNGRHELRIKTQPSDADTQQKGIMAASWPISPQTLIGFL
jgi:hypothetical protein